MRRYILARIAKLVCAIVFIPLGIGMYLHPQPSAYFYPGGRFSGPHTIHESAGQMKCFAAFMVIVGLCLAYSAFRPSRK